MSIDPSKYRPEDLACLVADVILSLLTEPDADVAELAIELVSAVTDVARHDGLASAYYWAASLHAALAGSIDADEQARHRLACVELIRAGTEQGGTPLPPTPVADWPVSELEDHWLVSLAAQTLAVIALGDESLIAPDSIVPELTGVQDIAMRCDSPRLREAVAVVSDALAVTTPPSAQMAVTSAESKELAPELIAARLVGSARHDICSPELRRSVLAELAELDGSSESGALRAAALLEALAIVDAWPLLVSGPPAGWGHVRDHALFDSLFFRAASIGAGRRSGQLPWLDVEHFGHGPGKLWLREAADDLSEVHGVAWLPGRGWRAERIVLAAAEVEVITRIREGRIYELDVDAFDQLGDAMLRPLVGSDFAALDALSVMLSPRLRAVPVEALRVNGKALVDRFVTAYLPCQNAALLAGAGTWSPAKPIRVIGLFDRRLPGVASEVTLLRRLYREGLIDGVAFSGPRLLARALEHDEWDYLSVGAHGTVVAGAPLLEVASRRFGLPEVLDWRLPPVVSLASCYSGVAAQGSVPLEWVSPMLRRGARSVLVSRWAVPDSSVGRIVQSFVENLASGYDTVSLALRRAVLTEREVRSHPAYWAGLCMFGDVTFGAA